MEQLIDLDLLVKQMALAFGAAMVLGNAFAIIGKVAKVDENEVQVEVAEGVKIKIVRTTVSEVRGKGEGGAPQPKKKS